MQLLVRAIAILAMPAVAGAGIVAVHDGDTDPATEGWTVGVDAWDAGNPPSHGPVTNDMGTGIDAWRLDTLTNGLGSGSRSDQLGVRYDLDAAEIAEALTEGWRLTARMKVSEASYGVWNSGRYVPLKLGFYTQTTVYQVNFHTDGGDLVLSIPDPASKTFDEADSHTLTGGAGDYHWVQIHDADADGQTDVLLNGVEVLSDYPGGPVNLTSGIVYFGDGVGWGGAAAEGDAAFAYVEFEVLPEPATLVVLALGGLAVLRRRP
jgi:hypothetical protein